MLAEFIEALAEQAVKAAAPQIVETDPTKTYVATDIDGNVQFIGGKVHWRNHHAQDLVTIAAFADRFDFDAGESDVPGASIWYSRSAVVCLVNDLDRRERVTVRMLISEQAVELQSLATHKPLLAQKDLLFMLRTVFTPNALPMFPKLIDTLRQVKFEQGARVEGNIQRGKSSVGKELSAAATFLDTVPEQVTLSVPLFDNAFARRCYDVICALEIHEGEMKFQLFPLPGEIEKAFAAAETDLCASIRDLLGSNETPVYFGCP